MYSSNTNELGDLGEWYTDLLQAGTTIYQKYTAIKDIKKQKKELEEYNKAIEESRRIEAQFREQQAALVAARKAAKPAGIQIPFMGEVDTTTMMILGGLAVGFVLLKRR